jgi:outer membrane protein with beta-barrel domain
MKRILIVVLGLLALLPCRSESAEKNLYFLGGVTFSNLSGDADQFGDALALTLTSSVGGTWTSDKNTRTGFDVGAGFGLRSESPLGWAAEVHYVERGVDWDLREISGSGVTLNTSMKLAYVEIPILAQVIPKSGAKTRPVFFLGPVLGIRASSSFDVSGAGASNSQDISDGIKSTYYAALFGAGLDMRLNQKSSLLLQGRFQVGLSNLIDDPTFSVKPQDFSLHAGYSTRL